MELRKAKLWIRIKPQQFEQFININIFGIDLESQLSHNRFEFIFYLFIVYSVLIKISFKKRMIEE
jgi:hypothetical protein